MNKLFQTTVLTKFNANSLNNPKVEVLNKDAFVWAKNTKKQYDVWWWTFQILQITV
jgi:spermidine synthase